MNSPEPLLLRDELSVRTQIIGIVCSFILFVVIVKLIHSKKLKEGYSLLWFLLIGWMVLFSIFDFLLFRLSDMLGIFYAPATLFSILIINILLITIHYSLVLSKHEKRITKLAQEISFLKQQKRKQKSVKSP